MDVYGECLIRTATTNGIIMLTFTPLSGMSEVVLQFMPAEFRPDRALQNEDGRPKGERHVALDEGRLAGRAETSAVRNATRRPPCAPTRPRSA